MFRALVATAIAVAVLAAPVAASGSSGWLWPAGSTVSLGYGETYVNATGVTCTHGGIDIAADEGASVRACGAGTVAFSGLVPAGAGMRAYAVTILTAEGLKVTYLPLARSEVKAGSEVSAGQELGSLAAHGDGSSAASHLHLGVKRGERQIDPLALLGTVRSGAPEPPVEPQSAPAAPPTPAHAPGAPAPRATARGADAPVTSGASTADVSRASVPIGSTSAAGASALIAGETGAVAVSAARGAAALGSPPPAMVPRAVSPLRFKADAAAADMAAVRNAAVALLGRLMCAALAAMCARSVVARLRGGASAGATPVPVAAAGTRG